MAIPIQNRSHLTNAKLLKELYPAAKRLRDIERTALRSKAIAQALAIAVVAALVAYFTPTLSGFAAIFAFAATFALLFNASRKESRIDFDYLETARAVEAEHPELNQALITAVEQQLAGENGFFAAEVVKQALASESRLRWHDVAKRPARKSAALHFALLASLALSLFASFQAGQWSIDQEESKPSSRSAATQLYVEPGDKEVERGSSLVVTARFEGSLPETVTMEVLRGSGQSETITMARSLSDPVFAYSLQGIDAPVQYQVHFADRSSELYQISTYELPDLRNANAALAFPDYTGWENRTVMDTLRVSAIEGTRLAYTFNTNKPVASAYLLDRQGTRIDLQAANGSETEFLLEKTLSESKVYALHLADHAGRSNRYPPEVRIDSIENKRPTLQVEAPKGDLRVSALEEVLFSGTATDDFGLLDFGIGFAFAEQEAENLSLAGDGFESGSFSETLQYLLPLEGYGLEAKDTFSWYLWASDFGPDGTIRRTAGDLYFADVRSFDEIFREQDQGGGGQGQAAGEGMELLEKQRRIAISLFRIKNSATDPLSEVQNLDVVQMSQAEALQELQQLIPQLQEASSRQHATEAQRFMEGVEVGLNDAIDQPSLDPLELAWSDAQNAYDKLVKLSDDEFNVSRSQEQSQGSGGGASRNQAQINELDFRQEDSRYETASEAQTLTSPDERKDLELMGKLGDLSRRQDDLNERLQEMQSELATAQTEEERERIQRELKRLEEEQRQMLADADEAIQQAGNREGTRETRQRMEEARENMREASENLQEGQVSQALASGTRAQDTLEQTREQMREDSSSEFSDALRKARSQARELAESQQELESDLSELDKGAQRKLDDSAERADLARKMEEQSAELERFLDDVREITEASENVEPGLFRDLYQVLRDSNSVRFDERYENSAQYLRQGFVSEAQRGQRGLANDLEAMSEAIADAAEGILGSESATIQFAQSEIDSLSEQLEEEREAQQPSSSPQQGNGNSPGDGAESAEQQLRDLLAGFGGQAQGPLSGGDFGEWIERLSTVESLLEEPAARARVSQARESAENLRRDFKRHGELPQWDTIEDQIAAPLNQVSAWLAEELQRIVEPDTLQAIDRDPVPEEYDTIVRSYYESLGND